MLGSMNQSGFSQDERDEFIHVPVGIEIEEAEVLVTEGKIEAAIEQLVPRIIWSRDFHPRLLTVRVDAP
jgi:hypothetical protein